jgi:hypothetical protein
MITQKQEVENRLKEINTTPQDDVLGIDTPLPSKTPTQPLEDEEKG